VVAGRQRGISQHVRNDCHYLLVIASFTSLERPASFNSDSEGSTRSGLFADSEVGLEYRLLAVTPPSDLNAGRARSRTGFAESGAESSRIAQGPVGGTSGRLDCALQSRNFLSEAVCQWTVI
jgi:hypothetical protein